VREVFYVKYFAHNYEVASESSGGGGGGGYCENSERKRQ
jgi:hypothetical protein